MTSSHRISNLIKAFDMPDVPVAHLNHPQTSWLRRGATTTIPLSLICIPYMCIPYMRFVRISQRHPSIGPIQIKGSTLPR